MTCCSDPELEAIEVDLLLEAVHRRSGVDLRSFARTSLCQRLRWLLGQWRLPSVSALQGVVLRNPDMLEELVRGVSWHPRALFETPSFFRAVRERVVPVLRTHPYVRVWVPGCATGEDAWALAIVLQEEGLAGRFRVYATESSDTLLGSARSAPTSEALFAAEGDYLASGGRGDLVALCRDARSSLYFAPHHLPGDESPNEFQLICCRGVLVYYNRALENRVHHRLFESLARFGYLGLGQGESLTGSPFESCFEPLPGGARLFRRIA